MRLKTVGCVSVQAERKRLSLRMLQILLLLLSTWPGAPVQAEPLTARSFAAQGRVEGVSEPLGLAFTIAGRVHSIAVEEGAAIRTGQLLAELECSVERANVEVAEAVYESEKQAHIRARRGARDEERAVATAREAAAVAELAEAEANHERVNELVVRGNLASRHDLDQAQRALDVARSNLEVAMRSRDLVNAGLLPEEEARWVALVRTAEERARTAAALAEQCAIRSPLDGVLLRRHVLPGEVVTNLVPKVALTVIDRSQVRVRAEVDERDALLVQLEQQALIWVSSTQDPMYAGTVKWISPVMGRKSIRGTEPGEKSDRDILEVLVQLFGETPTWPIGTRVTVRFNPMSSDSGASASPVQ